MTTLSAPLVLRSGLRLANRLAKAAMSESLARSGEPTADHEVLYQRWSLGGAGLLLTGNVMVDRRYRERMRNVVFDERTDRAAVKRWASSSRASGNATLVQLSHPGRQTNRFVSSDPVAPSDGPAVALGGAFARPRGLREEEIEAILAAFVRAATMARDAGFDGVQIHAAHGYLVSQFLSPLVNRREDQWGGSLENRARFLLEAVRRVRAACGAGFTLSVKLNSSDFQKGGFTPEDSLAVAAALDAEEIDLLEISGGSYESLALLGYDASGRPSTQAREAYFLDYARDVRARTRVPLMLTGGFRTRAAMEEALASGAVDVIGLARPLCVEPDLPARLLAGTASGALGVPRPRTRLSLLQPAAETGFYVRQLERLARGAEPDLDTSASGSAFAYVALDAGAAIARSIFGE